MDASVGGSSQHELAVRREGRFEAQLIGIVVALQKDVTQVVINTPQDIARFSVLKMK